MSSSGELAAMRIVEDVMHICGAAHMDDRRVLVVGDGSFVGAMRAMEAFRGIDTCMIHDGPVPCEVREVLATSEAQKRERHQGDKERLRRLKRLKAVRP